MQPCTARSKASSTACPHILQRRNASLYMHAVRGLLLAGTHNKRQALQGSSLTEKSSSSSRPPSPPVTSDIPLLVLDGVHVEVAPLVLQRQQRG